MLTLIDIQSNLVSVQTLLSNTTTTVQEAKIFMLDGQSLMSSNLPIVLTQTTETLKAIQETVSGIHDSQQDYHKFIMDNWGKIVLVIIGVILLFIFHGLILRWLVGKKLKYN